MAKLNLSPEARRAKNEYQKLWASRNRDKVNASLSRYWERKAREMFPDTVIAVTETSVTTRCKQCGNEFTPQRSTAKFCSDICRVRYNRDK